MGNAFIRVKQRRGKSSQMPPRGTKRGRAGSAEVGNELFENARKKPVELYEVCKEGILINNRYEVLDKLGAGSFGVVLQVRDIITENQAALKISKDPYPAEDVMKEAEILKKLKKLDNRNKFHIVRMLDGFIWRQRYCLMVELLTMNLGQFLYRHRPNGLEVFETKTIIYQLLETLEFLCKRRMIHCDLKPQNIMLTDAKTLHIKVIDFGSSDMTEALTNVTYFQTRFYRAPEVILGMPVTPAVDMWSLGCIMAELHSGQVLFQGVDQVDQMNQIVVVLGIPPASVLLQGAFTHEFFVKTRRGHRGTFYPALIPDRKYGEPGSRPLVGAIMKRPLTAREKKISAANIHESWIIELVLQMLEYDATKRLTASKAKKHLLFHEQNRERKVEGRAGVSLHSRFEYFRN